MRRRYLGTPLQATLVVVLGLFAAPLTQASDCDLRFQLEPEYYVLDEETFASSVVAGDWNEDGRVDLATANPRDHTVSVLLGGGGFRFGAPARIGVGEQPHWLAIGDLNHDGHLDLTLTGNFGTRILEGNGRGGFTPAAEFAVPGTYMKIGDLDGDGDRDLAVAGGSEIALVLLGAGGAVEIRRLPPTYPSSLDLADFDHDGDLDLVAGHQPGVSVWINDGAARFAAPVLYENGCPPPIRMESVSVGDMDADGNADILGVGPHPSACGTVLLGRGDGTFGRPADAGGDAINASGVDRVATRGARTDPMPTSRGTSPRPEHVPVSAHFALLADLNGDGRDENIGLRVEKGSELMGRRSLPDPNDVIAADVNEDGKLDLIVAGNGIAIHPGNGDGTLRRNVQGIFGHGPARARLADFNRDGVNDIGIGTYERELEIVLGTPGGGFNADYTARKFAYGDERSEFADVDGDGVLDDLTWEGEMFRGRGDGTFDSAPVFYLDGRSQTLSPGDVNEDGIADLALVVWGGYTEPAGPIRLMLGNGDGTFRDHSKLGADARFIELKDLDRDGHLDLLALGGAENLVLYGGGDGRFTSQTPLPSIDPLSECVYGDIDGDGLLDVVPRVAGDHGIVFLNRTRRFESVATNLAGRQGWMGAGDLDGDGLADVVQSDRILLGNGDGTFRDAGRVGPDGLPLLTDRDGDGRLDLVMLRADNVHGDESSATVIFNRTTPNHAPVTTAAVGTLAVSWPPNHELATVGFGGITDLDGDAVTVRVTRITQDEPVGGNGPDARVVAGAAQVRLERDGQGDGRVYVIHFDASDGCGGVTAGQVSVCVPHDRGRKAACADDGQRYNSLLRSLVATEEGTSEPERPLSVQVAGDRVGLRYAVTEAGPVRLEIFDVAGRRLALVDQGPRTAGVHQASWNAAGVARGIYFARLRAGTVTRTGTILLR